LASAGAGRKAGLTLSIGPGRARLGTSSAVAAKIATATTGRLGLTADLFLMLSIRAVMRNADRRITRGPKLPKAHMTGASHSTNPVLRIGTPLYLIHFSNWIR
jgi:hypothetical protein